MEPIAVVGLAFKLPGGAEDDDGFWDILQQGKNVMTTWPKSRTNIDAFYDADPERLNTVRRRLSLSTLVMTDHKVDTGERGTLSQWRLHHI